MRNTLKLPKYVWIYPVIFFIMYFGVGIILPMKVVYYREVSLNSFIQNHNTATMLSVNSMAESASELLSGIGAGGYYTTLRYEKWNDLRRSKVSSSKFHL